MGMKDLRLLRWAANTNYAADMSGNAWRDGLHPTKIEPDAADFVEGYANDRPIRAEKMNWLQNKYDELRESLVINRLTQCLPQINVGEDRPSTFTGSEQRDWNGTAIVDEDVSGVCSERLGCFVHAYSSGATGFHKRAPNGAVIGTGTLSPAVSGRFVRGAYVRGAALASSYSLLIDVGGGNVLKIPDSGSPTTLAGGVTNVDAAPIVIGSRMYWLGTTGGFVFCMWHDVASNSSGGGSTGLATTTDGVYQLHLLPSGRVWVTTSRRAAYTDNGGTTWTFDGAAAGASQGEYVVYDRVNARWIRFGAGVVSGGVNVRTAASANNPTASSALKQIVGLALLAPPVVWGRFVFSVGLVGGRIGPMVSHDYGITWAPCSRHFTITRSAEGTIGSPAGLSSESRVYATPFGLVASYGQSDSATYRVRMIVSDPMVDALDGVTALA